MDIKQIKYFLELAGTLNFTRGADHCNVTQPTLTKAIQRLEAELGGPLVYRDGKDTRLTELGRQLRGEFESIASREEKAREIASTVISGGQFTINVGVSSTLGPKVFSRFIGELSAELLHVRIIVHEVDPGMTSELVLAGTLDGCFCSDFDGTNHKLQSIDLFTERLLLAISKTHRLASKNVVEISELASEDYVDRLNCEFRSRVNDHIEDANAISETRIQSTREDWVQQIVADGLGVCMVPEHAIVIPGLELRPVNGINLERKVQFISIFGPTVSKVVRRLRDKTKEYDWLSVTRRTTR